MKAGFVPALGTPLDKNGRLCAESFKKQINDQIAAGAVGLLCMGSMGIQACIKEDEYFNVTKTAVEAAEGRVPVFIGAMDTSVMRAKDRLCKMESLDVAGFVFTAPYYSPCTPKMMLNFFKEVAGATKRKILLYDLPVVTQSKITYDMVLELLRDVPNFAGIKSADMQMFRKLTLNPDVPDDFIMVYSGLDTFDIAYKWGIDKCLDGMCSCTPKNSGKMFKAMANGDYNTAADCLNNIVKLRDAFISWDLWPAYSTSMNLLGYEGCFAPDYCDGIKSEYVSEIRDMLVKIGEL